MKQSGLMTFNNVDYFRNKLNFNNVSITGNSQDRAV